MDLSGSTPQLTRFESRTNTSGGKRPHLSALVRSILALRGIQSYESSCRIVLRTLLTVIGVAEREVCSKGFSVPTARDWVGFRMGPSNMRLKLAAPVLDNSGSVLYMRCSKPPFVIISARRRSLSAIR